MAISPFSIYLWQQVDKWSSVSQGAMALCIGATLFYFFIKAVGYELKPCPLDQYVKWIIPPVFVIAAMVNFFVPSSKTIAMMAVLPAVANSRVIQQDVPDLYAIAIEALKAELKPEATEKKK